MGALQWARGSGNAMKQGGAQTRCVALLLPAQSFIRTLT